MTLAAPLPLPVRVNRAPVLTLWAAVVAEALGHPEETALTLGSAVAGTAARAKARRLGLAGDGGTEERRVAEGAAPTGSVRLLGHEVPVVPAKAGLRAAAGPDGRPQSAEAVRRYLERAFGGRLAEVRAAMRRLAASLPAEALDRHGVRLYDVFRPDVPEDVRGGWRAKGFLHLDRIAGAAAALG